MIAEVKRQPRSNRRSPPLGKEHDKPEFTNTSSYILLPFLHTVPIFPEGVERHLLVQLKIAVVL